jgi:hypothetical protein
MASKARLFHLKWNNSKMRISEDERQRKRACVGAHFGNGFIALENGACFANLGELKHHLDLAGVYTMTYEDEEQAIGNDEQEVAG